MIPIYKLVSSLLRDVCPRSRVPVSPKLEFSDVNHSLWTLRMPRVYRFSNAYDSSALFHQPHVDDL